MTVLADRLTEGSFAFQIKLKRNDSVSYSGVRVMWNNFLIPVGHCDTGLELGLERHLYRLASVTHKVQFL